MAVASLSGSKEHVSAWQKTQDISTAIAADHLSPFPNMSPCWLNLPPFHPYATPAHSPVHSPPHPCINLLSLTVAGHFSGTGDPTRCVVTVATALMEWAFDRPFIPSVGDPN